MPVSDEPRNHAEGHPRRARDDRGANPSAVISAMLPSHRDDHTTAHPRQAEGGPTPCTFGVSN